MEFPSADLEGVQRCETIFRGTTMLPSAKVDTLEIQVPQNLTLSPGVFERQTNSRQKKKGEKKQLQELQ